MADSVDEVTLTIAVRQVADRDARSGRAGSVAHDHRSEGVRPVARQRRQAHRARQCRAGQSARVSTRVTSTAAVVAPITSATGGDAVRIEDGAGIHLPRIVGVRAN